MRPDDAEIVMHVLDRHWPDYEPAFGDAEAWHQLLVEMDCDRALEILEQLHDEGLLTRPSPADLASMRTVRRGSAISEYHRSAARAGIAECRRILTATPSLSNAHQTEGES